MDDGHQNDWLEAWMRTGLFQLVDREQLNTLAQLIGRRDWDFGKGTVSRWYKRFEPLLWEGAKMAMTAELALDLPAIHLQIGILRYPLPTLDAGARSGSNSEQDGSPDRR